jgi:hypothetical protein
MYVNDLFFVKVGNTKVVEKLYTFLVLKFHYFIPSSLGDMIFQNSLPDFDDVLCSSGLVFFDHVNFKTNTC